MAVGRNGRARRWEHRPALLHSSWSDLGRSRAYTSSVALRGYYLGCPGWGDKRWLGRLFPPGTRPTEFLAHYARVFNTVEGNTTFYALPAPDLVARWRDAVPDDFRFCFKFPRTITHERMLAGCDALVDELLDRLAPLALGTLMIQLSPGFDRPHLPRLAAFLDRLPRAHHYAVELRHANLMDDAETHAILAERDVDLTIMDTRALRTSQSLAYADVRARKPDLPFGIRTTGTRPIVRCVPHESFAAGAALVEPWADQLAAWIAEGKQPTFFMHAPDDTFAPENAYEFHAMLRARTAAVGELPAWPGAPRQLGLF